MSAFKFKAEGGCEFADVVPVLEHIFIKLRSGESHVHQLNSMNRVNFHVLKTVRKCHLVYDSIFASSARTFIDQHKSIFGAWSRSDQSTPRQCMGCSTLEGLLDAAAQALPVYSKFVEELIQLFPGVSIKVAGLKHAERIISKASTDYDGDFRRVIDVVRGSIIFPDLESLNSCLKFFTEEEHEKLLRVKSGFIARHVVTGYGYRDVKLSITFCEYICELQLHAQGFYCVKNEYGHELYKWARSFSVEGITDAWQIFERDTEGSQTVLALWLCSHITKIIKKGNWDLSVPNNTHLIEGMCKI